MERIYLKARLVVSVAALSFVSTNIVAQASSGMLEEQIVTAKKRAQSLQDVSISVNVVTGRKLEEAGITKVEDLQAYVPNLTMSETGIGTNIYIRGIGSGINQGFEQSVGMYKDGVSLGRAQLSRSPFLDLERVEVLRGPQNILYGKNSIAGAISLITAQPTDEFEGSVSLTYEPEYGEQIADLVLSGPLTETLSGRLATRFRTLDGYVKNIDGGDEPGRDEKTTRLTLRWAPDEVMDATLMYEKGSFDVTGRQVEIIDDIASAETALGGANWSQFLYSLNPLNTLTGADQTPVSVLNTTQDFQRSSNGEFSNNDNDNVTLTLNFQLNDLTFTSVTSALEYEYEELCDCDFSSANLFFVESEESYSQFSQEFRLTSPGGEKIDWMAGFFYQTADLDFTDSFFTEAGSGLGNVLDSVLPGLSPVFSGSGAGTVATGISVPRTFRQDSDVRSAFFQMTWNIDDVSRLTLGGRYSSEQKSASRTLTFAELNGNELDYDDTFVPNTSIGVDYLLGQVILAARHDIEGSREESKFAPSATYEYDFNDLSMAYVNWAQGFKAGGYDVRSNVSPAGFSVTNPFSEALDFTVSPGSFEYDQEESETIEAGIKTTLLDGSLEVNVAAFITDYENLQVSIFDGSLGFNVGNAGAATTQGIELDSRWALSDNFALSAALAWLDFEFTDFADGQCTQAERIAISDADLDQEFCDYAGKTNQYVADFSGYISAAYEIPLSDQLLFEASLDMLFTTDYNPTQNIDPSVEEDGYTKFNMRLAILDADDVWDVALIGKNLTDESIVTYANDTPLSTGLAGSAGHYGFVEPPRTLAVQGTFRF